MKQIISSSPVLTELSDVLEASFISSSGFFSRLYKAASNELQSGFVMKQNSKHGLHKNYVKL